MSRRNIRLRGRFRKRLWKSQESKILLISRIQGEKSLPFAEMLIDSAKIESDFQEFKQAENMLKVAKHITEKGQ